MNAIEVLRISADVWIMSQSISNERSGYWPRRRELRLKCVLWGNDFTFETSNPNFDCGASHRAISPTAVKAPDEDAAP